MLEVTEKARGVIQDFLEQHKGPQAVRILLQAGWGGPRLGLALDEPQKTDVTYTDHGVTFAIEKDLLEKIKPIRVDFVESAEGAGFTLASSLETGSGCGSSCEC